MKDLNLSDSLGLHRYLLLCRQQGWGGEGGDCCDNWKGGGEHTGELGLKEKLKFDISRQMPPRYLMGRVTGKTSERAVEVASRGASTRELLYHVKVVLLHLVRISLLESILKICLFLPCNMCRGQSSSSA